MRATRDLRAAAALMSDAQRIANFGSWEWRLGDDSVVWSDQLYRIFGLDPGAYTPTMQGYIDHVQIDDRERVGETIRAAVAEGESFLVEHRIARSGPGERRVRCQGEPLRGPEGEIDRVIGVCQDVTDLAVTERARGEADARFRSAFENAPIGVALAEFDRGPEGRVVEVNRSLCELLGRTEAELIDSPLTGLGLPEEREETLRLHQRLIAGELDHVAVERRSEAAGGRVIWTLLHLSVVRDADGVVHGIAQVQDITERKEFEQQLRHVADHDSLTGLLNRRRFTEELEAALAQKSRYGGSAAALVIDVDNLKTINDTHGHSAGDEALRSVADALSHRMRSTDVVARLGGDEFSLLLPNADSKEADRVAGDLLHRLSEQQVEGISVSVSIGSCVFDGAEWESADEVIAEADAAMYQAKQEGGGRYERAAKREGGQAPPATASFTERRRSSDPAPAGEPPADRPPIRVVEDASPPAPQPARVTTLRPALEGIDRVRSIRELITQAIRDDGLLLYAQPVFDLRSGDVAHRELLVRMRGERSSILVASEFLGLAAQDPGLCTQVDLWVVRAAVKALTTRRLEGRLQINLSGESLANEAAMVQIAKELDESGLPPGSLAFEVAEEAIGRDVDGAVAALGRLAEAGAPIVLDGFSAGFGSLEYLQRLPLEQIKIAGSVVRALEDEEGDHATLRAIVKLARGTNRTTVAKLVESDALLPLLRMHGVDMAQGFDLAEPSPVG
jgi:diguanylate cyclase (GGDEF)-like protein/PAS domain S-box-containing protein